MELIQEFDQFHWIKIEESTYYNNRGLTKKKLGELESSVELLREAIEDYDKAVDLDPESSTYYGNRDLAKKYLEELESLEDKV